MRSLHPKNAARLAALAAAYFVTARLGLSLGAVGSVATTIWPPAGISLAALLLFGTRLWPGIAVGAFLANLSIGVPWEAAAGIAAGNTLAAASGAFLITRLLRRRPRLDRTRGALALVAAAVLSPVIAASLGVACGRLSGMVAAGETLRAWRAWWLGDAAGDLLVAPLLLTWAPKAPRSLPRALEAAALAAAVALVGGAVFGRGGGAGTELFDGPYAFFPLVTWAALRFGAGGAAAAAFGAAAVAAAGTCAGLGPYARADLSDSLLAVQTFMAFLAVTSLILAAVGAERDAASRRLRGVNQILEQRVRERTAALTAANDDLQALTYSIAHDLRVPLRIIMSFSQLLQEELGTLTDDARKDFGTIQSAVRRMGDMIDGLLELAGMVGRDLRHEPVDLSGQARAAAAELARLEPSRRVTVSVQDGLYAEGDPPLLNAAIANLIGNAWKFTRGREDARIEFSAESREGAVVYRVKDNGTGFDPAHSANLFRPFQRLHSTADFPGTGLGLAMVRRVIEKHGGRVWAESTPGGGACFYFTLRGSAASADPGGWA